MSYIILFLFFTIHFPLVDWINYVVEHNSATIFFAFSVQTYSQMTHHYSLHLLIFHPQDLIVSQQMEVS